MPSAGGVDVRGWCGGGCGGGGKGGHSGDNVENLFVAVLFVVLRLLLSVTMFLSRLPMVKMRVSFQFLIFNRNRNDNVFFTILFLTSPTFN